MAQNKPLAGNDAVREYLNLLMEARPEAGREYAALLFQMDGMHRQLDAALKELAQVRGELARMQECPEKGFLAQIMEAAGKRLHAMRQGLMEMKGQLVSGAKEAVEGVKRSGIKALDKAVSAAGIKKGLEVMYQSLAGSIEDVKKSIEKVETVGRELRSVGAHLKNAGCAAMGREQQEVDGGTEGRFQAALLAPMRKEKDILDRVNNLVLAAMGSVERLEREAEKAREGKREDRGETERNDAARGTDKGKAASPGKAGDADRAGTARPDEVRGTDMGEPGRFGRARVVGGREPDMPGNTGTADRGEKGRPGRAQGVDRAGSLQGETARPRGMGEAARMGNERLKPSVLKDIQEKKQETVARPAPMPGKHLKTQEAAL